MAVPEGMMKRAEGSDSSESAGEEEKRPPSPLPLDILQEEPALGVRDVFLPGSRSKARRAPFDFEHAVRESLDAFRAGSSLDEALPSVLQSAARALAVDFALLAEPKGSECEIIASYCSAAGAAFSWKIERGVRYSIRDSLCLTTLMMDEPWTLEEPQSEARVAGIGPCRTFIGLGVTLSDDQRGCLSFFSLQTCEQPFSEAERLFITFLGREISLERERLRSRHALSLLESRAEHAQKLETLGMVASSVAHDFSNLLMGILGNIRLALNDTPEHGAARPSLHRIERIAEHAAELSKQLLTYSGKASFTVEVLNLSSIVEEMVQLLQAAISKKHVLKCNFPSDLPIIDGDASQISQVVMNLVTNASEAIGDQPGVVTISTGLLSVDQELLDDSLLGKDATPGVYTYIRVADTGCGMHAAGLQRAFDPFYSTKFSGSGLGLSVVGAIVASHRGIMRVQSAPGHGTTFTVLFPCSANQGTPNKEPLLSREGAVARVLIVDDEQEVREVVAELLRQSGYEVCTASDGSSALQVFAECAAELDLAIVDLSMPDIDGVTVLRRMHDINADVPVVLSSGYAPSEIGQTKQLPGCAGFLHKPYRLQELRAMIEPILAANKNGDEA